MTRVGRWGAESPTSFEDHWQFGNFRNRLPEKRETMHGAVNRQEFIESSLDQLVQHLNEDSEDVRSAVAGSIGSEDPQAVASEQADLASKFSSIRNNGCIPHQVQTEKEADPGCTPFVSVNRRQTGPDSGAATSVFVMLNFLEQNSKILTESIDEDYEVWGSEMWDGAKGRLAGTPFTESDFDNKLKA